MFEVGTKCWVAVVQLCSYPSTKLYRHEKPHQIEVNRVRTNSNGDVVSVNYVYHVSGGGSYFPTYMAFATEKECYIWYAERMRECAHEVELRMERKKAEDMKAFDKYTAGCIKANAKALEI